MRWAAKRDANEPEVRQALELAGWKTFQLAMPGWPDLLCVRGRPPSVRVRLVEVKTKSGRLNPAQVLFFPILAAVGLPVAVVRNREEALEAVK